MVYQKNLDIQRYLVVKISIYKKYMYTATTHRTALLKGRYIILKSIRLKKSKGV